jgi:hypothetical protein
MQIVVETEGKAEVVGSVHGRAAGERRTGVGWWW